MVGGIVSKDSPPQIIIRFVGYGQTVSSSATVDPPEQLSGALCIVRGSELLEHTKDK